jgi:hypothetical protein
VSVAKGKGTMLHWGAEQGDAVGIRDKVLTCNLLTVPSYAKHHLRSRPQAAREHRADMTPAPALTLQ